MNLPFSWRQKIKIALFLFCIMVSLLLIRFLEDSSLKNMDRTFSSIYNDRLVPATDLFQISEQVYAKRHLIEANEEHKRKGESGFPIEQKLNYLNLKLDFLVKKYESTYLVRKEKEGVNRLKLALTKIDDLEKRSISEESLAFPAIKNSFDEASSCVSNLIQIQSHVGEELIKNAQKEILSSKLYASLQFILTILIGVLILAILLTANLFQIKSAKFSLN